MNPKVHAFFGAIFSLIIYLLFPNIGYNILIVFFSTFMFDIDHLPLALNMSRTLNPFKAYSYFVKVIEDKELFDKYKPNYYLCIFHTIEFYLLMLALCFFNVFFIYVFIGLMFHQFIDLFNKVKKQNQSIILRLLKLNFINIQS